MPCRKIKERERERERERGGGEEGSLLILDFSGIDIITRCDDIRYNCL